MPRIRPDTSGYKETCRVLERESQPHQDMSKISLEQAFAIGRPAQTSAHRTCSRCQGTGWWQFGRTCFKCGGAGRHVVFTLAMKIRDKRAHVEEVRGIISAGITALATARFGRAQLEKRLADRTAQLATLEAELAALEAM